MRRNGPGRRRAGTWLCRVTIHRRLERILAAVLVALGLGLAADTR
ncbi:hypothetical protein [Nocardia fluminea]